MLLRQCQVCRFHIYTFGKPRQHFSRPHSTTWLVNDFGPAHRSHNCRISNFFYAFRIFVPLHVSIVQQWRFWRPEHQRFSNRCCSLLAARLMREQCEGFSTVPISARFAPFDPSPPPSRAALHFCDRRSRLSGRSELKIRRAPGFCSAKIPDFVAKRFHYLHRQARRIAAMAPTPSGYCLLHYLSSKASTS